MLLCRATGSYGEHGPTLTMTTAVLFLVLTSAWITDRVGIHAIFGGFVAGLVIPYEIRAPLTEKIEDLVASLFLPIYFVLSGLKTDLGLLSDGSIWGWTFCVIFVAFFSKFLSCGAMGKVNGLHWRESGAVGSLMACKGLVEVSRPCLRNPWLRTLLTLSSLTHSLSCSTLDCPPGFSTTKSSQCLF